MRGRPYIGWPDPVARGAGDRPPLRPGGATGPLARLQAGPTGRPRGGRQAPPVALWGATGPVFFFLQGLRCKFEEKKLHFSPVAPHRTTEVYF